MNEQLATVEVSTDEPGTVVVRIGGELDLSSIAPVESAVAPALGEGPNRLIVEVTELRFADSSAIALWLRWAAAVQRFELRNPPPFVRRVLATMGLSEQLGVGG